MPTSRIGALPERPDSCVLASINLPERGKASAPASLDIHVPRRLRVEFFGTGGEYFRIWIVNIVLSVLTLGIYSAWAKVRNKQYFYGSSRLDGAGFEYTANPVNILKGRLLVVGVLVVYQLLATFAPVLGSLIVLGFVLILPWVVVQALAFNARYSSHRGLRFHFDGRYPEAFRYYLLWTAFAIFSGGLAYPYAVYLRKRFILGKSRYGSTRFRFGAPAGYFYVVYVIAAIALFGLGLVVALIGGGIVFLGGASAAAEAGSDAADPAAVQLVMLAAAAWYLSFLALIFAVFSVVQTALTNHIWRHAELGKIRFYMGMNPMRVLWIHLSNVALIVASAGLFIPWAKVRITRYRLSCFRVLSSEPLDNLAAGERERITATGEEFGEALDLDLGL